ncbi:hypothetical protein F5B19DRAFT_490271 [Rostrohypoxylon terebratum]|nr:hypothetical protein F5B19DRAFT_490271 [Rostrohypoxylon terebratum]
MASLLDTYQGLIRQNTPPKTSDFKQSEAIDVILTGSTGTEHDVEQSSDPAAKVFNVRNPYTSTWDTLLLAIKEGGNTVFSSQSESVGCSAINLALSPPAEAATMNPAVKLLDFYREGLWATSAAGSTQRMSIDQALVESPTLHDAPSMRPDWMQKWVVGWIESLLLRTYDLPRHCI